MIERVAHFDVVVQFAGRVPAALVQTIFGLACFLLIIPGRLLIDLFAPGEATFALIYPSVLISTLFGRWRAGLVTYLSAFAWTWYFFVSAPRWLGAGQPVSGPRTVVNLVAVLVILILAELFRSAVRRAADQRDAALLALEEREARVRLAVEAGRLGSLTLPLSGFNLITSERCRRIFGRDPTQPFTYSDLLDAVHPDDKDRMAACVSQSIETGAPYDIEYGIITPLGEHRWVQVRAETAYDKAGEPISMTGVSLDITERVRSAAALRHSEERFKAIANSIDHMVWSTRPDGFTIITTSAGTSSPIRPPARPMAQRGMGWCIPRIRQGLGPSGRTA